MITRSVLNAKLASRQRRPMNGQGLSEPLIQTLAWYELRETLVASITNKEKRKMTKKDYKAIAEEVRSSTIEDERGRISKNLLVQGLSVMFAKDNPRFDAERFRVACYGEPFKK